MVAGAAFASSDCDSGLTPAPGCSIAANTRCRCWSGNPHAAKCPGKQASLQAHAAEGRRGVEAYHPALRGPNTPLADAITVPSPTTLLRAARAKLATLSIADVSPRDHVRGGCNFGLS